MTYHWIIIIAGTVLLLLLSKKQGKHYQKLNQARKVFDRLQELDDSSIIPYIRKIDPYVFEELILLAFRDKGYKTIRNKRYSGDGGIDGRIRDKGKTILIQDKRYNGYIQPEHVKAFDETCRKKRCNGYFIHSGKTGQYSRNITSDSPRITIISGQKLINLLRKYERENPRL